MMFRGLKFGLPRTFNGAFLKSAQLPPRLTANKHIFNFNKNINRCYATYVRFGNKISSNGLVGYFQSVDPVTKKRVKWGLVILGIFIASRMETAPITKRWRLMLFPNWVEGAVSKSNYQALRNQFANQILPPNHPDTVFVKKVFSRIVNAASNFIDPDTGEQMNLFASMKDGKLEKVDWEIMVIDDTRKPMPNAMLLGNGKVIVFRSILGIAKNEDGLATVLGHELGHQLQHHILEGLSRNPFGVALGMLGYSMRLGDVTTVLYSLVFDRPASRGMESEADYIGLMLMARACYNPYESPKLWDRMDQYTRSSGGNIPEFLSTHPANDKRKIALTKWLPKALHMKEMTDCHQAYQPFRSMAVSRGLF